MTVREIIEPATGSGPYNVLKCPICADTTPAGVYCGSCQPFPASRRCIACAHGGPVIAGGPDTTTTIGAVGQNDDPGTCTVNPGGNEPPGLNSP